MVGGALPQGESGRPAATSISELRRGQELAERVSLLEQAPLFSVLRGEDIRDLADKFHAVRYRRAAGVLPGGAAAAPLFLLVHRRAEATTPLPTTPEVHRAGL